MWLVIGGMSLIVFGVVVVGIIVFMNGLFEFKGGGDDLLFVFNWWSCDCME